jgi:hypothetical protein
MFDDEDDDKILSFNNFDYNKLIDQNMYNIFAKTEIYHALIYDEIDDDENRKRSILFRLVFIENKLYFLLYDYINLKLCVQTEEEIFYLHNKLNSNIESNDAKSFINFILDSMTKNQEIEFMLNFGNRNDKTWITFNKTINLLNLHWIFQCIEISDPKKILEFSQKLFIQPINNLLITLGNLINNSNNIVTYHQNILSGINYYDAKILVKNNLLKQKRGFLPSVCMLTKDSSMSVNGIIEENKENNNKNNLMNNNNNKNSKKGKVSNKEKSEKIKRSKRRKNEKVKFKESDDEKDQEEIYINDKYEKDKKKEINENKEEEKKEIEEKKVEYVEEEEKKDNKKNKKKKIKFF